MDITQITILVCLAAITTIIIIAGIYFIGILQDVKTISAAIAKPVHSISEIVTHFTNLFGMVGEYFKKGKTASSSHSSSNSEPRPTAPKTFHKAR